MADDKMILDFTAAAEACSWEAIDDRIMGGCSQSNPHYVRDVGLCFSGTVSLENNGGFASIRSSAMLLDLSRYNGITLRLRGDGRTYKLSLRMDRFFDGVSYQAEFTTEKDVWQEVALPFSMFLPTHHGIRLTTVAPIDARGITSFGLFIADRQKGPFRLEVAWIAGL